MKKRILVVTDCTDIAANELHAVLTAELNRLQAHDVIVEPIVKVREFSVLNASFAARLLADTYAPEGLTILAVVNPFDTSDAKRARIAGRLQNGIQFVGANTGIFSWLINDFGIGEVCEIDNTGLKGEEFISFGGKYFHAPAAARLAASGNLEDIKIADFHQKDLLQLSYAPGTVLHVDNFGVAKLFFKADELKARHGDRIRLAKNGSTIGIATFCHSMKEMPDKSLVLYKGSSFGLLEAAFVRQIGSAHQLGVDIGDVVEFTPEAD
jgi:S-adenosylmethionine hydrolase